MQTEWPSFVVRAAQWRHLVTQNTHCWCCVLDEVFYRLPFKKRSIILCISVKNKINHMEVLAIRYYRYVKERLQLLDVQQIQFSWRNAANPYAMMRVTVIRSTECSATCCSRQWILFCKDNCAKTYPFYECFGCTSTYFAVFVRIYSCTLFPFAEMLEVRVESPYIATEL